MKVIVAGPLECSYWMVSKAIERSGFCISELVSTRKPGTGALAARWAKSRGIPVRHFCPDWDGLGKAAAYERNKHMVAYADAAIVLWNGDRELLDIMARCAVAGLPLYIETYLQRG